MMSKGGVVAVSAIVGLGALFAFMSSAKAKPKTGPSPTPDDPHSPEACAAYKIQKSSVQQNCNAIKAYIVEIDAARIEAASAGNDAALAELDAIRAGQVNALANCQAQVTKLNNLIAGCA